MPVSKWENFRNMTDLSRLVIVALMNMAIILVVGLIAHYRGIVLVEGVCAFIGTLLLNWVVLFVPSPGDEGIQADGTTTEERLTMHSKIGKSIEEKQSREAQAKVVS